MVRDRFIDGQAECALRRYLDSLGPDTLMRDIVDSCRVWESHIEWSAGELRQTFSACGLPGDGGQPVTGCVDGVRDAGGNHETVVAEADGATSEGGPYSIGPRAAHTVLAGSNTATPASDTGVVSVDGYGNRATELASGRISYGGGHIFVGASSGVSGGVFFLWGVDPHNRPMSGTRRVISVYADGVAGGPHWGRVPFETGSRGAPKPTDGKRRLILTKDGPEVVVSGWESIITDPDVRGEICVMPD